MRLIGELVVLGVRGSNMAKHQERNNHLNECFKCNKNYVVEASSKVCIRCLNRSRLRADTRRKHL